MGQANKRGTFEQRKAQALLNIEKELATVAKEEIEKDSLARQIIGMYQEDMAKNSGDSGYLPSSYVGAAS